jgi:hypothetical protein
VKPVEVRRLARRVRRIQGWFSPGAAALFALLDEVQREHDVHGDLFEIGVHHGRSAVLLCRITRPDEIVGACDLFERQEFNVSASGGGDRVVFERNVARFAPGFDRLVIHEKSSADLRPDEIGGPYRLFHVDGGHSVDEAYSDIRLGATVLHEAGAIVVDDPFRPEWPGVTEAILRFLKERPEYCAVAIGFNKLVLICDAARGIYEPALASPWAYVDPRVYAMKSAMIAGRPTSVFYIPSYRQFTPLEPAVARGRSLAASARRRLSRR